MEKYETVLQVIKRLHHNNSKKYTSDQLKDDLEQVDGISNLTSSAVESILEDCYNNGIVIKETFKQKPDLVLYKFNDKNITG